jgi:hypothetical protein
MTDGPETATCNVGAMELSRAVHEALRAVVDREPAADPAPSSIRRGGEWHCPADGSRMHESQGHLVCPACGRHLPPPVLYQLIEFHVHRGVGGADRNK